MKEAIPEGSQEERGWRETRASVERRVSGRTPRGREERSRSGNLAAHPGGSFQRPLLHGAPCPARPPALTPQLSLPAPCLYLPRSPHQFLLCIVRSCVVPYEPSIRSTFPYVIEHLPPPTPGTVVHARDTKMIGTRPLPLRRSLGRALACNTGPILCHRPLVSASFPSCQTAFPEHAHASPVALPIQ